MLHRTPATVVSLVVPPHMSWIVAPWRTPLRCLLAGIVLWVFPLLSPAEAQSQVTLETARQYTSQLQSRFWEEAWVQHLEREAKNDGTINWHYGDRQSLNELTADYQRAIGTADGFWSNLQVLDYLQRQLLVVQPNSMMPGRPGTFRLRILSSTTPNALALNDGTIILTTGLLTTLRTRGQLRAILAHEVAHVILDHALTTYQAGKKGKRARKILGSILGGVTSVVAPGLGGRRPVESTVYDLSSGIATRYLDREIIRATGLKYTRKQEQGADRLAQQWLLAHDAPPAALHNALRTLYRAERRVSTTHGTSFSDSHPQSKDERQRHLASLIEEQGGDPSVLRGPLPPADSVYDTRIAAVLEHEAEMDLAARRFRPALTVLNRALRTEWTTPETYLFKAIAVRNTTTGRDGIAAGLRLLDTAETVSDRPEPRIEAERALLRMRQGRSGAARAHLSRCIEQIETLRTTERANGSDAPSLPHESLYQWATKMHARLATDGPAPPG